ncbi:serine/threonine protein kinase [Aquitalea aquatilis]|uniref:serine/threonine protein kinase n=1 Tax=Aquitalea aquatilis TaxID=1537400 RepID=UPI0010BD5F52|nr:serine/threonine protein kinase [Aquitalea aquatilis]
MRYPSLEQYQVALQSPRTAFIDASLASGSIPTNMLSLPEVISGGFALTYRVDVSSNRYAVRCFHKESTALEQRYTAIAKRLRSLASPYFLTFEYQSQGVRVDGAVFPLVKMAWASGETLGEFLEAHHKDRQKLSNLQQALRSLATYLEQQGIAHGDIQTGNLMVSKDGRTIQLIDYDGMFVPEVAVLGSSEIGHLNFQHPKRGARHFDSRLDRFSFILLDLALRALQGHPQLWVATQCESDSIIFRANDFIDPPSSGAFTQLFKLSGLERDVKNFAAICQGGYSEVPSLAEFINGQYTPRAVVALGTGSQVRARAAYLSQYPVLDGGDYLLLQRHIGQMVELVGRIIEVSESRTRHGKPYVFINFADWRGQCVKLTIWSTALSKFSSKPTKSWEGRWVSTKGLVDPIYRSKPRARQPYEHISITISAPNQILLLDGEEALYRLGRPNNAKVVSRGGAVNNSELLSQLRGNTPSSEKSPAQPKIQQPQSSNQQLLAKLKSQQAAQSPIAHRSTSVAQVPQQPKAQHTPTSTPARQSTGSFQSVTRTNVRQTQVTGKKGRIRKWMYWGLGLFFLYLLLAARHA